MFLKTIKSQWKILVIGLIIGSFVGFIMALPFMLAPIIGDWHHLHPTIACIWQSINLPASWLADSWINSSLRCLLPRGEIAWLVTPCITIIIQWIVVFLIISLIVSLIKKSKKELIESESTPDSNSTDTEQPTPNPTNPQTP